MNENINLCEILKNCPKGTKLYTPLDGEVIFMGIREGDKYPIITYAPDKKHMILNFTIEGKYYDEKDGECLLFTSKGQRDWSKFKPKKPKFDPKTLQPFDRVLSRIDSEHHWKADIFSYYCKGFTHCITGYNAAVIPYNEDTKHLIGTTEEAPEYYRYWED